MDSIFKDIVELEKQAKSGALCTVVKTSGSTPRHSTSKMLVYPNGSIKGSVGGGELENRVIQEAITSITSKIPKLLEYSMVDPERGDVGNCGGQVMVFIEPITPAAMIVVIGAGHVGKAVVQLSKWLGFRVAVSDDRPGFCTPESVPDADLHFPCDMKQLPENLAITDQTFLILTTRGASTDIEGLPSLMQSDAAYIGVIGSKRRWHETEKQLLAQGISEADLSKIYSPIGMKINSESPEEIALSILAEILSETRKGIKES
ncbi:XdhC family protein [Chloroflexota bacterium]